MLHANTAPSEIKSPRAADPQTPPDSDDTPPLHIGKGCIGLDRSEHPPETNNNEHSTKELGGSVLELSDSPTTDRNQAIDSRKVIPVGVAVARQRNVNNLTASVDELHKQETEKPLVASGQLFSGTELTSVTPQSSNAHFPSWEQSQPSVEELAKLYQTNPAWMMAMYQYQYLTSAMGFGPQIQAQPEPTPPFNEPLTVKTSQSNLVSHTSSAFKPKSSPKSPLDKAKEYNEMKMRKEASRKRSSSTAISMEDNTKPNSPSIPEPELSTAVDKSEPMDQLTIPQPRETRPNTLVLKRAQSYNPSVTPQPASNERTTPIESISETTAESQPSKPKPIRQKRRRSSSSKSSYHCQQLLTENYYSKLNKNSVSKEIDVHKPFLWSEDQFEPIIVKYDSTAYDICHEDDLVHLKDRLNCRLVKVNGKIKSFWQQKYSEDSSRAGSTNSDVENEDRVKRKKRSKTDSEEKSYENVFNVKSSSHPSLKQKGATKTKPNSKQDRIEKMARQMSALEVDTDTPPLTGRRIEKTEFADYHYPVLICIDNLFYEGRIKSISPPDIYGVVINGERHGKERIYTEEELISTTYANIAPRGLHDIPVGTRVCGYWSDVIGCLYAGTITQYDFTKLHTLGPCIDILFDDGDSGLIPITDVRLLPPHFPYTSYDPNSCFISSKRRTRCQPETPVTCSPGLQLNPFTFSRSDSIGSRKSSLASPQAVDTSDCVFDTPTEGEEHRDKVSPPLVTDPSLLLWKWNGEPNKRQSKGRGFKQFYDAITRDGEVIKVGDCAVFQPNVPSQRPYLGRIMAMWQGWSGRMSVAVNWFYYPEEIRMRKVILPSDKGGVFESDHRDDNDVQTIKHKCHVLNYEDFKLLRLSNDPTVQSMYYYLAGHYNAGRSKIEHVYV